MQKNYEEKYLKKKILVKISRKKFPQLFSKTNKFLKINSLEKFPGINFEKKHQKKISQKVISGQLWVNTFGGSLNGVSNGFPNKFPNGSPQIFEQISAKILFRFFKRNLNRISAKNF